MNVDKEGVIVVQELPQNTDWDRFWTAEQKKSGHAVSWSKKRILKVLSPYLKKGVRALDAGCGSGFFSGVFCDQGVDVTALDYSESALQMAKQATSGRARLLKADFLKDDLTRQGIGSFDIIFSDGLFEHFVSDDQDRIMKNLKAVLKSGGVIVTFVPNRWSPWELIRPFFMPGISETPFVRRTLMDLNERNGLKVVRCGGVNTLPFAISPEGAVAGVFGMLLYTVAS